MAGPTRGWRQVRTTDGMGRPADGDRLGPQMAWADPRMEITRRMGKGLLMLIYEDETALLRKGLFDVQNEVGLGHREEYYHKAMTIWLKQRGIPHTTKMALPLLLDNESACMLYPDLTVWGKITLEMKAVQRNLRPPEQVQIFNYLKAQDHKLGLLVNMGLDRVFVKRFLHEKTPSELKEDWTYWNGAITDRVRETGQHIRATIHKIYDQHQCGYGSEVIEKLITFGLKQNNLSFVRGPIATSSFQGNPLGATALDCLIIEEHVLLVFTALFDDNKFNISRGHSFMKALNVPWGIAVNFGKKTVQLNGLSIGGTALPSEAHNSSSSSSIIGGTALPSEAHNSSSSSSSIIRGTALPSEAHNSSSSSIIG
ncbi:MAG: GxxExxY protein, partial [Verrucomicrobiota bacterium]